jgi:hypothetical protein
MLVNCVKNAGKLRQKCREEWRPLIVHTVIFSADLTAGKHELFVLAGCLEMLLIAGKCGIGPEFSKKA